MEYTTNNPDFSPPQELFSYPDQFDNAYLADTYSVSPNYSLESFFDAPLGGPADASYNFGKADPFGPSLSNTSSISTKSAFPQQPQRSKAAPPFGKLEHYPFGFSFDPRLAEPPSHYDPTLFPPPPASSSTSTPPSRTPSLCGSTTERSSTPPMKPSSSPRTASKRDTPSSPDACPEDTAIATATATATTTITTNTTTTNTNTNTQRPQRKRGRPRLSRGPAENQSSTSSPSNKSQRTGRLPHNQVERKYREGLNSELERLRQAVPTLPQSEDAGAMGQPKPSKAMVLSSAIDYIKTIEQERDALRNEVEALRRGQMGQPQQREWKVEDNDEANGFGDFLDA